MSQQLSLESFENEPWFPCGIAQSLDPAASQVPEGFEAWRLHTKFGSHLFFWPTGDIESIDWWQKVIPMGGGGTRWGTPPIIEGGKIERVKSTDSLEFLLTEKGGRKVTIQLLPLDEIGNGRTLSELKSPHLNSAFGGLQVGKKDLLLFFRQVEGVGADELISAAIDENEMQVAEQYCNSVGAVLGKFHTHALAKEAMPNDERKWNGRLKNLEERVLSNTLWRAPHTSSTLATITHRNFGLGAVYFDKNESLICCCYDGIFNTILPPSRAYPSIRDLAAAYRSLASVCAEKGVEQEIEISLRKALFEGWTSTAPESLTSLSTLDSYRGGVPIWEYEQVLEEAAIAQAKGEPIADRTKWWLSHVNRIQAQMYRSRTFAALSLVCGIGAVFAPFAEQWIAQFSDRLSLAVVFALASFGSRWLYRHRAPPQY